MKHTPSLLTLGLLGCAVAAQLFGQLGQAQAANIVWQSPQRITGESDVKKTGTLLDAYVFSTATAGSTVTTVNTVPFKSALANSPQGYIQTSGAQYAWNGFEGGTGQPWLNLTTPYKNLLKWGLYGGANTITLTFNGLTGGQTYLIQLWVNNSIGTSPNTNVNAVKFTHGGVSSPAVDSMSAPASRGALGQYIVGYMTMGASETTAAVTVTSASAGSVLLTALQIRTVPDAAAWMADAKYGIFLNYLPGGVLPIGLSPTNWALNAMIVPPKTQSEWSEAIETIENNLNDIVDQIVQTGADYVVVSLGGSVGYYNANNAVYEDPNAHFQNGVFNYKLYPGEYTYKGDLIEAFADALAPKGIKVFVYIAAEGPFNGRYMTNKDGQGIWINEKTKAQAPTGVTAWTPAGNSQYRTLFNAMITEWSTRWGSKVAGWWFDGCFEDTGYGAAGKDETGATIGATSATANLDALIAAAKSGNPNALVAMNPGYNRNTILTEQQDYMAGERGMGNPSSPTPTPAISGDPRDKFMTYPTSRSVTFGAKTIQWHNFSFLGWTWRSDTRVYQDEELISYISKVSGSGGVITLDVYFNEDGTIGTKHFEQLKKLKAALKPTVAPAVAYQEPAGSVNLALFKPAYFRTNAAGNIGDPELHAYSSLYRANAGNDGDYRSQAEAAYYLPGVGAAYSYIVDLGAELTFDRIVFYPFSHYAKTYQIFWSTDGISWTDFNTTPITYTANDYEIKVHNTSTPRKGRYVKVKSLTADPNPVTMSINELEVYNVGGTGTLPTSKDMVWVDEYVSGINMDMKTVKAVTLTDNGSGGTWKWGSSLETIWDSYDNPFPKFGLRIHWSPVKTGHNEHGFTESPAIMHAGAGDSLYCWVYIDVDNDPAPTEILLRWIATDGTVGKVRWGGDDIESGTGIYRAGDLPATGEWVKLSVSASNAGVAGKALKGMSFACYGGKVLFDRAGKTSSP